MGRKCTLRTKMTRQDKCANMNPILGRGSWLGENKYLHRFCAILGSSTLSSLILFFMDFLSSRSSSSFLTDEDRNAMLLDKRKVHTHPFCRGIAYPCTTNTKSDTAALFSIQSLRAIILDFFEFERWKPKH